MSLSDPENYGGLCRTKKIRASLNVALNAPSSNRIQTEQTNLSSAIFFELDDTKLVELIGTAFAPELKQLTRAEPTAEASSAKCKGNLGPNNLSPSQLLIDEESPEVDRTVVGVLALKWLFSNDYDTFTANQGPKVKLTQRSFQELRAMFVQGLQGSEDIYALIVATMINDLGKDNMLWQAVKERQSPEAHIPNHDEVLYQAAELDLVPLMLDFPPSSQCYVSLMRGLRLGSGLNVAQFAQAENVPASLLAIQGLGSDKHALTLKFLEIVLDVAGAQGHIDSRSCLTLTEPLWQSYRGVWAALLGLVEQRLSPREAYDEVLDERARLLAQAGFRHLRTQDKGDRALLRLMCLTRAYSAEDATVLDEALGSMGNSELYNLVEGLSKDGINDGDAIIPYYGPSLFAVTLRQLGSASREQTKKALSAILRLLSRVYGGHTLTNVGTGRVIECDLHFVQETLKSQAFLDDPTVIDQVEIPEDAYGYALESTEIAARFS